MGHRNKRLSEPLGWHGAHANTGTARCSGFQRFFNTAGSIIQTADGVPVDRNPECQGKEPRVLGMNRDVSARFHEEDANVKLKPLSDRVVVEVIDEPETTASGIVLPDTAKEKSQRGKVIAVGPGRLLDNGERAPLEVKKGDKVVFAKYGGTEIDLEGKDLMILNERDIHAIIG